MTTPPGPYPGPFIPGFPPMSPPAPALEYATAPEPPPPGSGRGSVGSAIVAWVVIVAVVGLIAAPAEWFDWRGAIRSARTANPAALPAVEQVRSGQVQLAGRYAVGARGLTGGGESAQYAASVENAATDPLGRFRAIPVVAELLGPAAALERLDRFEAAHTVVRLRRDVDVLRALYGGRGISEDDRRYLEDRHGWAGKLAGTFGASDSDPARRAVLGAARRTLVSFVVATFAVLLALAAGLGLLVVAIVQLAKGKFRHGYRRPGAGSSSAVFAEAVAIYLGLFFGGSVLISIAWPSAGLAASYALAVIVPLAVAWIRLRGVSPDELRYGLGLHAGRGVFREIGAGVVGYIAGLPVVALGMLVTILLIRNFGQPGQGAHPIADMPMDTPLAVVQLFLIAAVLAPVTEEVMFRGALLHHLRRRLPWLPAALITSLIFAAIHPQGWVAIPTLTAIAMVLAGIRQWRGSLIGPVTAHALNNAGAVLFLLLAAA